MKVSVRGRKPNLERHRQVAELRGLGLSVKQIGSRIGISYQRVLAILHNDGLAPGLPPVCCPLCGAEIGPRRRAGLPNGPVQCLDCLGRGTGVSFGQRLRTCRLRAGLSQGQLAARAGLARTTIAAYEREQVQPSQAAVGALAAVLGMELVEGTSRAG